MDAERETIRNWNWNIIVIIILFVLELIPEASIPEYGIQNWNL